MTQVPSAGTAPLVGKVIYTARICTTGGRESGTARSSDGLLDVRLSAPGSGRLGTNPEQLFAAGWSACLESAIALAARKKGIVLPAETSIDAEVDLSLVDGGYFLSARLDISLPGVEREVAQAIVEEADRICAYSKATRGNIDGDDQGHLSGPKLQAAEQEIARRMPRAEASGVDGKSWPGRQVRTESSGGSYHECRAESCYHHRRVARNRRRVGARLSRPELSRHRQLPVDQPGPIRIYWPWPATSASPRPPSASSARRLSASGASTRWSTMPASSSPSRSSSSPRKTTTATWRSTSPASSISPSVPRPRC